MNAAVSAALRAAAVHFRSNHEARAAVFIQAVAQGAQRPLSIGEPGGVREIGACQQVYALDARPLRHIIEGQLAACGARKRRMQMQIGGVSQSPSLRCLHTLGAGRR